MSVGTIARSVWLVTGAFALFGTISCDSGRDGREVRGDLELQSSEAREELAGVQAESQQRIREAQMDVQKTESEHLRAIEEANRSGHLEAVDDAKVDATRDIADAERNVDDAKVEGTEQFAEEKRRLREANQ